MKKSTLFPTPVAKSLPGQGLTRRAFVGAGLFLPVAGAHAAPFRIDDFSEPASPADSSTPPAGAPASSVPAQSPPSSSAPRISEFEVLDQGRSGRVTDPSIEGLELDAFWRQPRHLVLTSAATGERFNDVYWRDGRLVADAYSALCWLLRDHRADASRQMSPGLLDILYAHNAWLRYYGITKPLVFTSAYRSPKTNAGIEGAALNSQHPRGTAADILVPGVRVEDAGRFARWLSGGGVGVYPVKGHLHVDSGPIRSWDDYSRGRRRAKK